MTDRKFLRGIFQSDAIELAGIPVTGTATTINTALNAALTALGFPQTVSSNLKQEGLIIGSMNRVELMSSSGEYFFDPANNRVYGRLVQNGVDFNVEFFSFDGSAEAPYDFGAAPRNLDFLIPYRFEFNRDYLVDAALRRAKFSVGDKTAQAGSKSVPRPLTITAQNVIPTLPETPEPGSVEIIFGEVCHKFEAAGDFTVVGQVVTVDPNVLGFNVDPGDRVVARYNIAE